MTTLDALVAKIGEEYKLDMGLEYTIRAALVEYGNARLDSFLEIVDSVDSHMTEDEQREWIKAQTRVLKE
jgi:hypothetical protein